MKRNVNSALYNLWVRIAAAVGLTRAATQGSDHT